MLILFAVMSFLFYNPILPLFLTIIALILNCAANGTYTFKNLFSKVIFIIMIFLVVLHGFANPAGKTPALFFGHRFVLPFFGSYTMEGFYIAMVFWLRMANVTLAAMLYVSTTTPTELTTGLQKLGLPFHFCFMLSMSLQLIPISAREARIIHSAQCARGLSSKNIVQKLRGLLPMFVPLVVSSLDRMETLSMSLESRAFGSREKPTTMYDSASGKGDAIFLVLMLALFAAAVTARVKLGNLNWINDLNAWHRVFIPSGVFNR